MESLKKNDDFRKCYNTGKSYVNRDLVLYVCGNDMGKNRIGISVSKKVGNSVVRHRITRLIRESYRLHEQMFNSGLDMVVVARSRAKEADYHRIEGALLHLAGKAGIYGKKKPLYSHMLPVRTGSSGKIRRSQGRAACFVENSQM